MLSVAHVLVSHVNVQIHIHACLSTVQCQVFMCNNVSLKGSDRRPQSLAPPRLLLSYSVRDHRLHLISLALASWCEERLTSREWTFVLKLLNLTDSTLPRSIRWGSASPQVEGTATSPDSFVYASSVNVPTSSASRSERRSTHTLQVR